MWADALQHTALQSLAADVASERIPAQGYAGMGVQNLSPYVVQLVADTGRVLLRVPPWTQSTHTPDVPCSYVIAQTVLAASPAALATVLQQYQVRVLLTHAALPERMEPLASSAALLGSLPPIQQVSSGSLLPIGDGSALPGGSVSVPMPSHVELVSVEATGDNGNPWMNAQAVSDLDTGVATAVIHALLWNGTSFDRSRSNEQGTLLASAARTATVTSSNHTNHNARGVLVTVNVTTASGTGGLTVRIQGIDPVAGTAFPLNTAPSAITATGLYSYLLYPGASGGGTTQATALVLPRTWNVQVSAGDSSSYTYSVGYAQIL